MYHFSYTIHDSHHILFPSSSRSNPWPTKWSKSLPIKSSGIISPISMKNRRSKMLASRAPIINSMVEDLLRTFTMLPPVAIRLRALQVVWQMIFIVVRLSGEPHFRQTPTCSTEPNWFQWNSWMRSSLFWLTHLSQAESKWYKPDWDIRPLLFRGGWTYVWF